MARTPFLLLSLLLLAAPGCVSPPIGDLPSAPDAQLVEILDADYMPFRVSPANRYAVVMSGAQYVPPEDANALVWLAKPDDILGCPKVEDPWVRGDSDQLTTLLLSKGYDVYTLDFGQVTPDSVRNLLDRLSYVANDDTQLFVAYSGEGDSEGLRTRSLRIDSGLLIPPAVTLTPKDLFGILAAVRGRKAVLINACESGVFAEEAALWGEFQGVVVTACKRGFATTPHEPTGTTAIFAVFLELYSDDATQRQNLATVRFERAGGLWTNLAHQWQGMWGDGLPISYEPAIFVSGDFWF
jgi:hypothetical protein